MFEGVVGNTALSDIAIDDVEFQENTKCETTAETLGNRLLVNCFGYVTFSLTEINIDLTVITIKNSAA